MVFQLLATLPTPIPQLLAVIVIYLIYYIYNTYQSSGYGGLADLACSIPFANATPQCLVWNNKKGIKRFGRKVVSGGKKVVKKVATKKNAKAVKKIVSGKKSKKRFKKAFGKKKRR